MTLFGRSYNRQCLSSRARCCLEWGEYRGWKLSKHLSFNWQLVRVGAQNNLQGTTTWALKQAWGRGMKNLSHTLCSENHALGLTNMSSTLLMRNSGGFCMLCHFHPFILCSVCRTHVLVVVICRYFTGVPNTAFLQDQQAVCDSTLSVICCNEIATASIVWI